ncbi:hypothetical protein ABZ490_31070 [Streptomyces sp. NPDC005811]|uniref:hypothetical protein n=1 Tax=Streptomyces sp. NPDC005811 TaxID=3154565 RepID=UPI0033E4C2EF
MHVTPRPRRAGARIAALAALTVAGSALAGGHAFAATNGDVKIQAVEPPATGPENDPHVCLFYIAAFNFDSNETANWIIEGQPPTADLQGTSGQITVGTDGTGRSEDISLADGHYKLTFSTVEGDGGPGKQKVFWVDCATGSPSPSGSPSTSPSGSPSGSPSASPSTSPSETETGYPTGYPTGDPGGPHGYPGGPHGGPPAGGGGLARDAAFGPVAGAAAVGVAAVGGVVWFRLRRRPHGAA